MQQNISSALPSGKDGEKESGYPYLKTCIAAAVTVTIMLAAAFFLGATRTTGNARSLTRASESPKFFSANQSILQGETVFEDGPDGFVGNTVPLDTESPTSAPATLPYPKLDSRNGVAIFYAVADIPYATSQLSYLKYQLTKLPDDAEFIIHIGDIRSGSNPSCPLNDYTVVAEVLKTSPIPVFIVPGDNEWNDCYRPTKAWKNWASTFMFFENNWEHNLNVVRMPGRNETMAFINKGTLFMGFNIPGGRVQDANEWKYRLSTQAAWAIEMIRYYDSVTRIGRIVMFSHADPESQHMDFYNPIKQFVATELRNTIPILVINGDGHEWQYQPTFFAPATSMLRLMVTGEATRPPHRITVTANSRNATFGQAFKCLY